MAKETEKLIEILSKQKDKYSEKQIYSAIIAEGYSKDIANEVIDKLYPKKEIIQKPNSSGTKIMHEIKKSPTEEIRIEKEIKEEPRTNDDFYKEVNYLLEELKRINKIPTLEIQKTEKKEDVNNAVKETNNDIDKKIEEKKKELNEIKILPNDDVKMIIDNKEINLNDYPRREWRNFRDKGKTILEIKEEKMQNIRQEIYALKRNAGRNNEIEEEENISEKLKQRLREKTHGRYSEKTLDINARNEAEKLRDKFKTKEIERKELDTAVENIYKQLQQNPNIYPEEESPEKKQKEEDKTKEKKKELKEEQTEIKEELIIPENNEIKTDLKDEFDLGLDLK